MADNPLKPRCAMLADKATAGLVLGDDGNLHAGGGAGDIVGPAGATDHALARFDTATGKLLQDSKVTADDDGSLNIPTGEAYKIDGTALAPGDVGAAPAAEGVTGGNSHDHTGGGGAQIDYADLSSLPSLGTAAAKTVGDGSGNLQENGAALGATQVVETDANKKLISEAKATGFNKALGTSAGQVAEGNHTHAGMGDVAGPGSSTDNNVPRFDSTSGKVIQASLLDIDDSGNLIINGHQAVADPGASPSGKFLRDDGSWQAIAAGGDVTGPAGATDHALARFDLATGKVIQNSVVIADDSGNVSGVGTLDSGTHTVTGDVVPEADNTRSLGKTLAGFGHLYLGIATAAKVHAGIAIQFRNIADNAYQVIDILSLKLAGTELISSAGAISLPANQAVTAEYFNARTDRGSYVGDGTHRFRRLFMGYSGNMPTICSDEVIKIMNIALNAYQTVDMLSLKVGGTEVVSSARAISAAAITGTTITGTDGVLDTLNLYDVDVRALSGVAPTSDDQTTGVSQQTMYSGSRIRLGQRKTISAKYVAKLGFYLKKVLSPTGNVTFSIRKVSDDSVIASKVMFDASALTTSFVWYYWEMGRDGSVCPYVNEEVRLCVEFGGGNSSNYVATYYSNSDVKASEQYSAYIASWADTATYDLLYTLLYAGTRYLAV